MAAFNPHDREPADFTIGRIMRRRRIRRAVSGNGTFSEDDYAELVAQTVERAERSYRMMVEKTTQTR